MTFKAGDRVIAESESTARTARAGVVEEVVRDDPSPRYRIRWDDGHESIYTPAAGALRGDVPAARVSEPAWREWAASRRRPTRSADNRTRRRGGSASAARSLRHRSRVTPWGM